MEDTILPKQKNHCADEKPKLDNARRLRGIYQIDPDDKEFNESLRNARKKVQVHMDSAMPCKLRKTSGSSSLKALKDPQQKTRDEQWQGEIVSNHQKKQAKMFCPCPMHLHASGFGHFAEGFRIRLSERQPQLDTSRPEKRSTSCLKTGISPHDTRTITLPRLSMQARPEDISRWREVLGRNAQRVVFFHNGFWSHIAIVTQYGHSEGPFPSLFVCSHTMCLRR